MTILRMLFAGEIKRADHKTVAGKPLVEVSLCKKHKGRNGGEDTFSWIKVSLWEPPEFMVPKLVKGAFIAGSGDYQLRSYEKDGVKGHAAEIRCTSFDVVVSDGQPRQASEPAPQRTVFNSATRATTRQPANPMMDDE